MGKFFRMCIFIVTFCSIFIYIPTFFQPRGVLAQVIPVPTIQPTVSRDPLPCSTAPGLGNCPTDLNEVYKKKNETCVTSYSRFIENPLQNHYWALDEEVTAQGKANERARQFIYWVISKNSIDNHPIIRTVWITTQSVALFLFILIAALFGIGLIVGQQSNFQLKIQVWPIVMKIALGLLYIVFSYALVIFVIQLSEILMKFFIEVLGGEKLFNIYFTGSSSQEESYVTFIGCKDLNYRVKEAVESEIMLLKITNITYYVMGIMLILRKILLWFLLFVAPFLALLMPFVFIRNVGWIWIGVFFQWVFYGPLFALFLGALAKIWEGGIPFPFDFSRTNNDALGYIYPTGINITYGGPAQINFQKLSALNNGNYVDTFVEYIITLIMLWAVTFFPWWLLRIFRDYCCDGIYAMKNVLMSMYDQSRSTHPPNPPPTPTPSSTGTSLRIPKQVEVPIKVRLETMEEIKKTRTEEISKSLNLSMNKITDIARFETNKQTNETIRKNLDYLSSPTKADTPAQRQKFMNIRTELFNRTIKDDHIAKQILSSISSSQIEQSARRKELVKTVPQTVAVTQAISYRAKISSDKVASFNNTFVNEVSQNSEMINTVSKNANIAAPQVQTVLTSFKQNVAQLGQTPQSGSPYAPGSPVTQKPAVSPVQVITNISKETGIEKDRVVTIIKEVSKVAVQDAQTVKKIAEKEKLNEDQVKNIIAAETPLVTEPEKHVEQTVSIPPSISIEDYEEVKKMWTQQYEKGEVPVSENITSREQWVDQDIVFITNTLNKLMSPDEKLKAEGIDDLGYILPIFLINNLKGEELAVYLKAKLEAAKHVKEMKDMEKQITEKLKEKSKDDEELVELDKTKPKEEAKHLTLEQELELPEEQKSKSEKPVKEDSSSSDTKSSP